MAQFQATLPPMYGHLYSDNSPNGQGIVITTQSVHVGIATMSAGVTVGLIADTSDAAGDNLEVPVGGAGDYEIIFNVSLPYTLAKRSEVVLLKNGSEITSSVAFAYLNDAAALGAFGTGACGVWTLADGDEIALGISNETDTANLTYFTAHLFMKRIGN